MKRVERLDTTTTSDGTELTLYRHDGAYSIRVDGVERMSTRRHHSEDTLAERVCSPIQNTANARVLIGGLGLGFTLKAALNSLGPDARVELLRDDVANVLKKSRGVFDGIMLDVDNGAESLTMSGNAQLYRYVGIKLAVTALRPGGRIAYWSANENVQFEQSLRDAALSVEVLRIRAHTTSGPWHTLFFARAD
ncbi:MAG: hypothetical protein ABI969_17715 [bacterium]